MLDKLSIENLIPHKANMCLLDSVISYSADNLHASSNSHLLADNPLHGPLGLGSWAGIEYAAQAVALHAVLQAQDYAQSHAAFKPGRLVAVRQATMHFARLDTLPSNLHVHVQCIMRDQAALVYDCKISDAHGKTVLQARLSISLGH